MKRLLFDTNVLLDVLLDREPHVKASSAAWAIVENRQATGLIAAHAVTTIHYLIAKEMGMRQANQAVEALLSVFEVAAVTHQVIQEALQLVSPDFEDAVVAAAARAARCDWILTRDPKGFRNSPVPSGKPERLLADFSAT